MKWRWMFFLPLFLILILFQCCRLLQKWWGWLLFFKTSFPFKSFTSISSQPSCMFPYECALPSLAQETAKILLSWGHPITMYCLYPSGGVIFSHTPSWISFSCLHGCLPSQLTTSVLVLGEGAVRYFRGKDANCSAAGCCFAVLEHSNHVNKWCSEI